MCSYASWLFLVTTMVFNAAASLSLKLSVSVQPSLKPLVVGGSLGCYGLSFLGYYMCLRSIPVSVAYPTITGGTVLAVVVLSSVWLGENLTQAKFVGAGLVILGAALLLRTPIGVASCAR